MIKDKKNGKFHRETEMMRYGYDHNLSEGSVKCPQFQTSTFVFKSSQHGKDFFNYASGRVNSENKDTGLIYSRFNNPNLQILEERIALWDDAEDCIVTGSGMSAIATTLFSLCKTGETVVYSEPLYGGTDTLLNDLFQSVNIHSVGFLSNEGIDGLQKACEKAKKMGRIAVIFIETPSNPTNIIIDINACMKICQSLENCVLHYVGPVFQNPLKHGADLCIYSLTKYIGGHSDLIGGSISGNRELIAKIRKYRNTMGTTMDSNSSWLTLRSLETLKIRMLASSNSASQIASFLSEHPKIKKVYHPKDLSLNDPQHQIYLEQCSGCSSTFSFSIYGDERKTFKLLDTLEIPNLAVSLGGTETLVQHPASMTHSSIPQERREKMGITDNLIRLSVGLEHPEDLIHDLKKSLDLI